MTPTSPRQAAALAELWEPVRSRGTAVVFTGEQLAHRRGTPGLWSHQLTQGYQQLSAYKTSNLHDAPLARAAVWGWLLCFRAACKVALCGPAHRQMVELTRRLGPRGLTVCCTVDGLLRRAGPPLAETVFAYGDVDEMRCASDCGADPEPVPSLLDGVEDGEALEPELLAGLCCSRCGGPALPAMPFSRQPPRSDKLDRCLEATLGAALIVLVGFPSVWGLARQATNLARSRDIPVLVLTEAEGGGANFSPRSMDLELQGPLDETLARLGAAVGGPDADAP